MAINGAFWASAGFTAFFGVIAAVAFLAYWQLRRMDDVVLRARMYMNRKRLFRGFLAMAIGMIALFALVLAALVAVAIAPEGAASATLPSAVTLVVFIACFGFVGFGCYNFYAMSRPPPLPRKSESEAP